MAKIAKEVLEANKLSGALKSGKIQLFEDQFEKLELGDKKVRDIRSSSNIVDILYILC